MHVAVLPRFAVQQRSDFGELVDDLRIRVPDFHRAEKRQILCVATVALNGIEDTFVAHAVAAAGVEVVDAVGR